MYRARSEIWRWVGVTSVGLIRSSLRNLLEGAPMQVEGEKVQGGMDDVGER